ncbi:MAG: hypothetical protein ACI3V0_02995 [Faecousia sp.]
MTGKELLVALGDVSHKYYDEAENDTIGSSQRHQSLRRSLLIAAVISLTLLLVGCAVVYALRLQDMSVGKETYTQHFDDEGRAIEPIEKTRDIITLYGHSGDAIQRALKEWYDFLETYDPDGALMDNNPDHPEIPNQYEYTYSCYTPDMVAKVDEIAAKYNLKLLEEWIPFQAWQGDIFLKESGVGSLVLPESGAQITRISGMYYPPYNFDMDFELTTDKLDTKLWGSIEYARKDYFPRDFPGGMDLSLFEQWDHTAPDGTPLLLALSNKGSGYIIAEQENAMLILHLDGNFSRSAYPSADEVLTRKQLEEVADLFDYTIRPEIMDRTTVEQQLEEAEAAYDAAHTYVPETYGSFGEGLKSRITMPNEKAQYAFYDLTGDGVDDLLVDFSGYGAINEWFTIQDGEVRTDFGISTYLCEGRVLETHFPDSERSDYAQHSYQKAVNDTALMDMDPETDGDIITLLTLREGKWYQSPDFYSLEEREISAEEAQAIMAQYPRIELNWMPLMEYPLSETQTLRDYLEAKDVRVSSEELLEIYKTFLTERDLFHYSHYRILDINGDGVEDLLLKGENDSLIGNTDYYWMALTYRYGHIEGLVSDFYLCEDGVIECVETRHGDIGVEINGHQFQRCIGLEAELLEFVAFNKATASWQTDWWDEKPISEEEAKAILAKYPRIDQGMRPISELLK